MTAPEGQPESTKSQLDKKALKVTSKSHSVLGTADVAEILGISQSTIRAALNPGAKRSVPIWFREPIGEVNSGRTHLWSAEAVEEMVEAFADAQANPRPRGPKARKTAD